MIERVPIRIIKQKEKLKRRAPVLNLFTSILTGLIMAGLFSSVLYVFAFYNPGETLNPTCLPTDASCSVVPSAVYSFGSNNFLGTGNFTTTGAGSFGSLQLTTTALGIGNGGTGTATIPTSGQLLIGNSTGGYSVANLTQGTGVSITNGNGTITISATGDTSGLVPYTGATTNVDLGSKTLTTAGAIGGGAITGTSFVIGSNTISDFTTLKSIAGLANASGVLTNNGTGTLSWASGMTYPGSGIANSTGSAWGTSYTTSGSGTVVALTNSPVFTTPNIGTATGSITGNAATVTGFSVTSGKTLTVQNNLTLSGTDGSTLAIGTGGTLGSNAYTSTAYAPINSPTFTGTVSGVTATMVGLGNVTNDAQIKASLGTNIGDLITFSAASIPARIADVAVGSYLASGGVNTQPVWATLNATAVGLGNVTNESKATMFTSPTFTGTVSGVTSTMVGLGNVTNNAQINASLGTNVGDLISFSAASTPSRIAAVATGQYLASQGVNTQPVWATLNATAVGLGNVTNDAQIKASIGTAKGDLITFSGSATPVHIVAGSTAGNLRTDGSGNWSVDTTAYQAALGTGNLLPLNSGGTAANLTAVNGGIVYSGASAMAISAAGSTGQILQSNGAAAPTWSTATYPATAGTSGTFLISGGTNWGNSTSTIPSSAGATANVPLVSNGTNYALSGIVLPASTTANRVLYSTGTSTLGDNANLTFDGTTLTATSTGTQQKLAYNANNYTTSTVGSTGNLTIATATDGGGGDIILNPASSSNNSMLSASGVMIFGGYGGTNNQNLKFDFEGTAGTVGISSTSSAPGVVSNINFGTLNLATAGTLTLGGSTTGTLVTRIKAGAPTESDANGSLVIDSSDASLYFRYGGAWHYVAQTGGFQIPSTELTDPISGNQINEKDIVLGMADSTMPNGNLHGVWVKWSSIEQKFIDDLKAAGSLDNLTASLNTAGSSGDGTVSGVATTTLLDKVTNVLTTIGISIKDGITNINQLVTQNFSANTANIQTAVVGRIQMKDQITGGNYCVWLSNGDWQKVKGNCADMGENTPAAVGSTTQDIQQQVQTEAQKAVSNATDQVVQQVQQAITQSANDAVSQVQQAAQQAQTTPAPSATPTANSTQVSTDQNTPASTTTPPAQTIAPSPSATPDTTTPGVTQTLVPVVTPAPTETSSPAPAETPAPAANPVSATSDLVQSAGSSLLNGAWNFIKWIFQSVAQQTAKIVPTTIKKSSASVSSSISQDIKSDFSQLFLQIKSLGDIIMKIF